MDFNPDFNDNGDFNEGNTWYESYEGVQMGPGFDKDGPDGIDNGVFGERYRRLAGDDWEDWEEQGVEEQDDEEGVEQEEEEEGVEQDDDDFAEFARELDAVGRSEVCGRSFSMIARTVY